MKRETTKHRKRGKVLKSDPPRKRARRPRLRSKGFEPATDAGVTKQTRAAKRTRSVVVGSDAPAIGTAQRQSAIQSVVISGQTPQFGAVGVATLIEACRARIANLSERASTVARTLYELYDYETDEPELWQCCDLVRQVLRQAHAEMLLPLSIVSCKAVPIARAAEIAEGCEAQQQWLRSTVHVIRATIYVLIEVKLDDDDEILPALRDLECGLSSVVSELERVIECCPYGSDRRAMPW